MSDFNPTSNSIHLDNHSNQRKFSRLKFGVGTLAVAFLLPLIWSGWGVMKIMIGTGREDWQSIKARLDQSISSSKASWEFEDGKLVDELNFAKSRWIQGIYESNSLESPVDRSILYLGSPEFSSQVKIEKNRWTNLGPPVAEIARNRLSPEEWTAALRTSYDQLLLDWSSEWETILAEVTREAYNRPNSTVQPWIRIASDWTPNWNDLERFYRGLQLRNIACLRSGRNQEPLENFRILSRVFEAVDSISWTGHSFSNQALQSIRPALWEGLALGSWDIHDLKQLQELIGELDPLRQYQKTLETEMQKVISAVENPDSETPFNWIRQPGTLPRNWYEKGLGARIWNQAFIISPHFQGRNLIAYTEYLNPWREVEALMAPEQATAQPAWEALLNRQKTELTALPPSETWLLRQLGATQWPGLTFQLSAETSTWLQLMETAVALERFKALNGSYPVRIEALEELELMDVTQDLGSAAPFVYQRKNPGVYRLYSRGLNLKDESGSGDDLVWEGYPSKNQEFASRPIF